MNTRLYLLLLFSLNVVTASTAQTTSPDKKVARITGFQDTLSNLVNFSNRYFTKVSAKADKLNRRMTKRTARALHRLQKQEEKIHKKLEKVDSLASDNLLMHSIDSLSQWSRVLRAKAGKLEGWADRFPASGYLPYLDTLKSVLRFLDQYQAEADRVEEIQKKLQSAMGSVHDLKGRMSQVRQIQQYISHREQLLQQTLGKYGDVFKKNLRKVREEAYYYKSQIKNYKALWQQPDKLERKALSMLQKVPAFKDFMTEHSALASLFNIAGTASGSVEESLEGLQTREMVQQELQQRLQAGGADGRARIQQQMARARQKLSALKDKLPGGGSTSAMPNFQPKDLKSHTFLQRLELGGNLQVSKPARFTSFSGITFPTTSDIAGQVAYKFSEKGSAGIGAAFKLGWGSSIRKIHFTAQGVGLRSFIDYKIRGTIYLNGGVEMNYNKTLPRIPELKNLNGWTSSALLGIEKKYKLSSPFGGKKGGMKGTMMLLFDFLYKQHIPQTQPLVFRVGYNF